MKIWYIHPYSGGPDLGTYWRPYNLGQAWIANGHEVVIFSAKYHHLLIKNRKNKPHINGLRFRYVFSSPYKSKVARLFSMLLFSIALPFYMLFELHKGGKPQAIIYSSPHPFGGIPSLAFSKVFKVSFIFEIRDLWPASLIEIMNTSEKSLLIKMLAFIESVMVKHADRIVTLMPGGKNYLNKKKFGAKIHWISNGVDTNIKPELKNNSKTFIDIANCINSQKNEGKTVFIYGGGHGQPNNLLHIIDAIKILNYKNNEAAFIFFGDGDQKQALIEQCKNIPNVYFYNRVSKEGALALFRMSDAGLHHLPYIKLFEETGVSPNKIFDYMLCNIPIVASLKAYDNPVIKYQIGLCTESGKASDLAALFQKFMSLSQEEKRTMIINAKRALREDFSYEVLAERYINLLKSLAHSNKKYEEQ